MVRRIYLDCTCLTKDSRLGKKLFPRLKRYYASRFRDFDKSSDNKAILLYSYVKYAQADPKNSLTIERVNRDYDAWLAGECAPDYACSQFRSALSDRGHQLIGKLAA